MLFNSYEFIFLFLPIALVGYHLLLPKSWQLPFLTLLSYIFYGWWDYRFCGLMFLTTVIDYSAGLGIHHASTPRGRKGWLLVSIVSGLTLLGFFKYFDLLATTTNQIAGAFHGAPAELLPVLHLTLPIGISFYTFHSMSYAIDVYRGVVTPARRFWDFACFVSLFTQLVAGPIIRYRDMAAQLISRTHTLEKATRGISLCVIGLVKKVILADGVAPLAQAVFGAHHVGTADAWIGSLAYTMQIYFDFSGYSDMAVGLGCLFGFSIPQNFNSPYKSISISDFWRRWHMSLSTWLRDYLYIPLGGNRYGTRRTYVNLFLTMLLGGLWHGANWTFVVWGGYHGLLLAIEKATGRRSLFAWAPDIVQRGMTFLMVLAGWIFFRCSTLEQAGHMFRALAGLGHTASLLPAQASAYALNLVTLPVCLIIAATLPNTWEIKWRGGVVQGLALAVLFVVCLAVLLVNSASPFLYFQF